MEMIEFRTKIPKYFLSLTAPLILGDLSTCYGSQSLYTVKVSMFDRDNSGLGKYLYWSYRKEEEKIEKIEMRE